MAPCVLVINSKILCVHIGPIYIYHIYIYVEYSNLARMFTRSMGWYEAKMYAVDYAQMKPERTKN